MLGRCTKLPMLTVKLPSHYVSNPKASLELTKTSVQRLRCSGVEPGSRASPQAPFSHVSKLWRGYTRKPHWRRQAGIHRVRATSPSLCTAANNHRPKIPPNTAAFLTNGTTTPKTQGDGDRVAGLPGCVSNYVRGTEREFRQLLEGVRGLGLAA